MKNKSYIFVIVVLIAIIIGLLGYNEIAKRKEHERLKNLNTEVSSTPIDEQTPARVNKIYCIGDSFTLGDETSSYPDILSKLTHIDTSTFGATYDQTLDTSIRMGITPIYTNDITIPADTSAVELSLFDDNGNTLDVLRSDGTNFTEVEIAGIKGTLTFDANEGIHTFTRSKEGEETYLSELTPITSKIKKFDKNSIAIIYTGIYDNNIQEDVQNTINYQKDIIENIGTDKYIVVGLTSKRTFEQVDDVNEALKEAHGDHFLDFRSYLLEKGLEDAKIDATNQDISDLEEGYIPTSLLQDNLINGNASFNDLLAKQIYEKLVALNYVKDRS